MKPLWEGKLGRIAHCCIYCGDKGHNFKTSPIPHKCSECLYVRNPIPELSKDYNDKLTAAIIKWCDEHNIDYNSVKLNETAADVHYLFKSRKWFVSVGTTKDSIIVYCKSPKPRNAIKTFNGYKVEFKLTSAPRVAKTSNMNKKAKNVKNT